MRGHSAPCGKAVQRRFAIARRSTEQNGDASVPRGTRRRGSVSGMGARRRRNGEKQGQWGGTTVACVRLITTVSQSFGCATLHGDHY